VNGCGLKKRKAESGKRARLWYPLVNRDRNDNHCLAQFEWKTRHASLIREHILIKRVLLRLQMQRRAKQSTYEQESRGHPPERNIPMRALCWLAFLKSNAAVPCESVIIESLAGMSRNARSSSTSFPGFVLAVANTMICAVFGVIDWFLYSTWGMDACCLLGGTAVLEF
jgi:hypothetical protein